MFSVPLRVKDHQYGTPIVDIKFHEPTRNVVSSCKKAIRIWNKDDGTSFCSVEPPSDINDVCLVKDTGMILVACEQKRMCPFYIPSLGHAPKWCSFLDNLTVRDPHPRYLKIVSMLTVAFKNIGGTRRRKESNSLSRLQVRYTRGSRTTRRYKLDWYSLSARFYARLLHGR
jgi:hypothetical protein